MAFALILALIVIVGYSYFHWNDEEAGKLAWHGKNGGLYYRYALYGVGISLSGLVLFELCYPYVSGYIPNAIKTKVLSSLLDVFPSPESRKSLKLIIGTLITSLAVARVLAWFVPNMMKKLGVTERQDKKDIEQHGSALLKVLVAAMKNDLTVKITLDDDKVYIGYPIEFDRPHKETDWLSIQPLVSGYRDEKKGLVLTTDYLKSIIPHNECCVKNRADASSLIIEDFACVVSVKSIVSCTLFDLTLYTKQVKRESIQEPADIAMPSVAEEPQNPSGVIGILKKLLRV